MDDRQLLEQYVRERSQPAFAELVRRHMGWVRAAAQRQVRDTHLADDVAQAVFLALARQAHRLHAGGALSTWLFQVTRYASSAALRGEARRRRHERQAAMNAGERDETSMTPRQWEQLSRMLDELVGRLRHDDRRAVLLRFYEQKSYPEMAAALGVTTEAARKRTDRAVEKLRQMAGGRELAMSASALSAGLATHVTSPAPAAVVANAIEIGAGGAAAAANTSVATIATGAIHMLNVTRLRVPLAAAAAMVVLAGVGVAMLDAREKPAASAAQVAPAATQPAPAPSGPPATTTTTAPAIVEDSPKAVVFGAFRAAAAGDADGLIARFDRITPQQARTLRQAADVMAAARRLSDAVKQQFGVDLEQTLGRTFGMGVAELDVAAAVETIHGQTATVEMKVGPGDIPLVRVGSTWKITGEVLATLNRGGVGQLHANLPAIDALTADVRAGKYKTLDELRQALATAMRPPARPRPASGPAGTEPARRVNQ